MNPSLPVPPSAIRVALDALSAEMDLFRLDHSERPALREKAIAVAQVLSSLRKQDRDCPDLPQILEVSRVIWTSGYLAQPVAGEDLALATGLAAKGWGGLLGAMVVAPCWQWADAPVLDQVPDWLWGHYVDWAYVAPCAGTALGGADLHLRKLENLAESVYAWSNRAIGAACVREAIGAFGRNRVVTSPLRSTLSLKRYISAQAGIWANSLRQVTEHTAAAYPRRGRVLRVGIVLREWSESASVRSVLPRLTALDPTKVSLHFFAERQNRDAVESACKQLAVEFQQLPGSSAAGIEVLRMAGLDVLIYAGSMATSYERDFAFHRIAPLQIVTDECPFTTGLEAVDLHLTADAENASEFCENLGVLPGPGFVWDEQTAAPTLEETTRGALGLPEFGPVMACAAPLDCYSPEVFQAWKGLLRSDPTATLLLLLPTGTDAILLEQIFHRLQASSGLEDRRFVVSIGDPRGGLSKADVYLDTYPYSAPTALMSALAFGVPAVTWAGTSHRSRAGARILRAFGQSGLVAADVDGYIDAAKQLIASESARVEVRMSLERAIESHRGLGDPVLQSSAFGELLFHAYDILAAGGSLPAVVALPGSALSPAQLAHQAELALENGDAEGASSQAHAILRSRPDSTEARSVLGRSFLLTDQPAQAVTCFMSALRSPDKNARDWLALGQALRAQKEFGMAITAYKNGLRLAPANIEGWLAIAEMAREAGVPDLVNDAIGVARSINMSDPRLAAFAA